MTHPLANIFQPLIDVFEPVLVALHGVTDSWGFSIVALTVIIRAVLLPLAVKQYRSMRALQVLAPEIKKLQERYKDDKQRQQQEVMRFYQENKVNPFASCLPLLAQLPVFLALFYLLQDDLRNEICGQTQRACETVSPGSADFLFIPDLTNNATGAVLLALIVLYVGSQLLSTILMATQAQDKTQRMIFMALPFVFIPFIINFPAGLLVYWITTNVWTVAQQYTLRKIVGGPESAVAAAAASGGGLPPSPSRGLGALLRGGGGGSDAAAADAGNGSVSLGKKEKAGAGARAKGGAAKASGGGGKTTAAKASGGGGNGKPRQDGGKGGPPPPSPRKKKKRSGRRR